MKRVLVLAIVAVIGVALFNVASAAADIAGASNATNLQESVDLTTAANPNWGKGIGGGIAAGFAVVGAGLGVDPGSVEDGARVRPRYARQVRQRRLDGAFGRQT